MSKKHAYKVKNWSKYNRALINRGNITLWFDKESIKNWTNDNKNGKRGRDHTYADPAIECALMLRSFFRLSLRKTQGFLEGLISSLDLNIEAPHYSTLSRRSESLEIEALGNLDWTKPIHMLIDASGLKVYGEGEWKMRVHGKDKRRTWRKLHIGIDRETQEIVALDLTFSNVHDSKMTASLVSQVKKLASVTGDKGYDNKNAYDPITLARAKAIIPPRSGAALKEREVGRGDVERNRNILENRFLGKRLWKSASGYSKRSLVETALFRFKSQLGERMHSKKLVNQITEARIGAQIINKMTHLGMPKSYKT